MDAIALGILTALFASRAGATLSLSPRDTLLKPSLALTGGALLLWIALWPAWPVMAFIGRQGLDGTLLALGTCAIILGTLGRPGFRATAPLRWLGRHSYEVYLTHEFVVVPGCGAWLCWQPAPLWPWMLLLVALSAALGALVARFFSEPLNRRLRNSAAH